MAISRPRLRNSAFFFAQDAFQDFTGGVFREAGAEADELGDFESREVFAAVGLQLFGGHGLTLF